jgi:hypothetical protein
MDEKPKPEKGQRWRSNAFPDSHLIIGQANDGRKMLTILLLRDGKTVDTRRMAIRTLHRGYVLLPTPRVGQFWRHASGETMQISWMSQCGRSVQLKIPETRILRRIRTTTLHREWNLKSAL